MWPHCLYYKLCCRWQSRFAAVFDSTQWGFVWVVVWAFAVWVVAVWVAAVWVVAVWVAAVWVAGPVVGRPVVAAWGYSFSS